MTMMYLQRSHKWRKRRQQPPCWRQQQLWWRRRNHHRHCHQCRHIYQQFFLPQEDLPPCLLSPFLTGRIYKKWKMKEEREEDFKPFKKKKVRCLLVPREKVSCLIVRQELILIFELLLLISTWFYFILPYSFKNTLMYWYLLYVSYTIQNQMEN